MFLYFSNSAANSLIIFSVLIVVDWFHFHLIRSLFFIMINELKQNIIALLNLSGKTEIK